MTSFPLTTIFTPTFNRRHTIDRLFKSLLKQTSTNFEWIVIDDGSTDNTDSYFSEIQTKIQPFPIKYIKKKNGGKHRAINDAVKIAQGKLFFIVDSDDYLVPEAIKKIEYWSASLDTSHKWAGIAGIRGLSQTESVGDKKFQTLFIDAKNTERRRFHLGGDKAEIYFTEVLKKYPFPEIDGENFLTEEIVWNAIARDDYYLRWYNEIIYICEYLDDGLSKNLSKIEEKNPQGVLLWVKEQLKAYPNDSREKIFSIVAYYNAVKKHKTLGNIAKELEISKLYLLLSIVSFKIAKAIH